MDFIEKMESMKCTIPIHATCRTVYTRPSVISAKKRDRDESSTHQEAPQDEPVNRSQEAKDGENCSDLYGWLSQHSPFQYPDVDGLVDLSTGIVADKSANAHVKRL